MKKVFSRNWLFIILVITMLASWHAFSVLASSRPNLPGDWDNALHFIIRHWHAVSNPEVVSNEDNKQTVLDGYIVPYNGTYVFYMQEDAGELKVVDTSNTKYVESVNPQKGIIVLSVNPYSTDGNLLESFSGFSLSAGISATSSDNSGTLTITYNPNVHLVKSHVFYINDGTIVTGSSNSLLFSADTPEKDINYVYFYLKDYQGHSKGDVVLDEDSNPIFDANSLPEDLKDKVGEVVGLSRIYNTLDGLRTNQTVSSVSEDGRTFGIDIESWFLSKFKASANIGFILDASGSMAFTSNNLSPINITDSELGLTSEQISKLEAKKITNHLTNGVVDWANTFLTDEELRLVLDPHNTDNSQLGVSGYSYFVYSQSGGDYAPLAYWDAPEDGAPDFYQKNKLIGYYTFNKGGTTPDDGTRTWLLNSISGGNAQKVTRANLSDGSFFFKGEDVTTGWPNHPLSFSANYGYDLTTAGSSSSDPIAGMLLDVKPSSGNFTISFNISRETNTDKTVVEKEILYIGSLNQDSENYFRATRQGGSQNRLKGIQGSNGATVSNVNDVFNKTITQPQRITYVFEDGKLTSYINGTITEEDNNLNKDINLSDYNIIFNAFVDGYDGAKIYIDDLYVFDKALSASDVKKISNSPFNSNPYNDLAIDKDGNVLGQINKDTTSYNSGWYYLSHGSDLTGAYFNEDIQTAKRLMGIGGQSDRVFKDDVDVPYDTIYDSKGNKVTEGGTGATYSPTNDVNTPALFYIDENGYVRVFYSTVWNAGSNANQSYVYYKPDTEYVRTESLRRALGSFVTKLHETSPSSMVSAVRFSATSSNLGANYDKLVLLDWTNIASESTGMLSLSRGDGGTVASTIGKNGVKQYNYGLTGGTNVATGLEAFKRYLLDNDDDSAQKYIVVFTDGVDDSYDPKANLEENNAIKLADELRREGYTIYSIILATGSVDPDSQSYINAMTFLTRLSGSRDNVFSTSEINNSSNSDDLTDSSDSNQNDALFNAVDALSDILTEKVLSSITNDLIGYNVQNYIDPRFDIVSALDRTWHLNGNGIIIVEEGGSIFGEYNLRTGTSTNDDLTIVRDGSKGYYMNIAVTKDVNATAKTARLYYDKDKDMYYLVWTNQTIPGGYTGTDKLSIWNSKITLRAKDDFIGGNAILTSGNDKKMNFVYYSSDGNASSGTNNMISTGTNEHPSKGFPRVTVNVESYSNNDSSGYKLPVFLGENYIYALAKHIQENNNSNADNFVEYLSRYVNYFPDYDSLEALYIAIKESGDTGLTIPYYYLPNGKSGSVKNQTGGTLHENDKLGAITFKWLEEDEYPNGGIIKDNLERKSNLFAVYNPLSIDGAGENRKKNNETLVSDTVYKWDNVYKTAVGEEQTKTDNHKVVLTTNMVSGEIALFMTMDEDVINVLKNMKGRTITYSADILRDYGTIESEKIGTITATYTVPNDIEDIDFLSIPAKVIYDEEYITNYGLPIGTYTLEENSSSNTGSASLDFGIIENVAITSDNEIYFTTNGAKQYSAPYGNGNEAYLGALNDNGESYTNSRYALFKITLEHIPLPPGSFPVTGVGTNYILIFRLIAFFSLGIGGLYFFLQKKHKRNVNDN